MKIPGFIHEIGSNDDNNLITNDDFLVFELNNIDLYELGTQPVCEGELLSPPYTAIWRDELVNVECHAKNIIAGQFNDYLREKLSPGIQITEREKKEGIIDLIENPNTQIEIDWLAPIEPAKIYVRKNDKKKAEVFFSENVENIPTNDSVKRSHTQSKRKKTPMYFVILV